MSETPPPLPPEHLRDPGDSWVEGPDGTRYWGRFGAAGALVWHPTQGVLLQLRAGWSHHGGTWGIPGGALKKGESAHHAALREAGEEAGVPEQGLETLHTEVFDLGFWSYTTVLLYARDYFEPEVTDHESVDVQWVPLDTVSSLDLHPGFEKSWPGLLAQIQLHTGSI
jgi:8-oxo-dGTP pyrophosphatase MutT (NUDIX family)